MVVRILVVDDYERWLRFIPKILQQEPDLQVIAQASDGLEAVQNWTLMFVVGALRNHDENLQRLKIRAKRMRFKRVD